MGNWTYHVRFLTFISFPLVCFLLSFLASNDIMLGTINVKVSPVRCRMDVQGVYGLWAGSRSTRAKEAYPPKLLCSETVAILRMCSVVW